MSPQISIDQRYDYFAGRFRAMASPCEVLVDTKQRSQAELLTQIAEHEARRIENKFSRYREGNIIHAINNAKGSPVKVDDETADLLDYAQQCFQLSNGLFDITSGVLRRAWRFDGSSNLPDRQQVETLLTRIGWQKVTWQRPDITLQPGMEIDLGGIGKEYAVDRVTQLIRSQTIVSCLVNFGGDICVTGPRHSGEPWVIGVENPESNLTQSIQGPSIKLTKGAIATSGDANRYFIKDGIRYSHILNPKTGWPVSGGPRSVTVAAATCTEAGILATLALLQGADAEGFLKNENLQYWCEW